MKLERFGENWRHSDYIVTVWKLELVFNETGACFSFRGKRIAGLDLGDVGGEGGWAISFDIGPVSVILGDLVHAYLRLAWYRGEWAYTLEISNHPKIERAEA